MISLDNSISDAHSVSANRMKDLGSICDELHIIVFGTGGENFKLTDNIFIYPTKRSRVASLFKAKKIGKKILSGGGPASPSASDRPGRDGNQGGQWIITAQDLFETGFIAWRLAKKFGINFEVQMHGDFYGNPYWKKERFINLLRFHLGKFVLKRAKTVRVVSERIKKSIESFTKIKINRTPIYTEMMKENSKSNFLKDKFSGAYPIILSVGNLVPVKNHKLLIEAFADIKKDLSTAQLVIVGDGPLRKILQATSCKLQANVEFVGYQKNLADFYTSADIFVHPSFYEGWGRAVIEAAHFGLPIVMTDVGLAGEIIKNNESGIIVPANDKEAIKNAIIKLTKDEELRKKLSDGAKRAVSDLSSQARYLNKIKEAWEAIAI